MSVRDSERTGTAEPGERVAPPLRVFVNYRREDSSGYAGRLYDDLVERLAGYDLFIDIAKIEPGADFVDVIDRALDGCDVVLAVIGRHWLTIADSKGRRRLDDPDDHVRLELEAALNRGMRLIPVRVQGAEMPSSSDLPETLRGLARRQAVELSDQRWRYDVETLMSKLEQLSDEAEERARAERDRLALEEEARRREAEEQAKREREERERIAAESAARQRAVHEQAEHERAERVRAERELAERKRDEKKRLELERKERERQERLAAQARREAEKEEQRKRRAQAELAEQQQREERERERAAKSRERDVRAAGVTGWRERLGRRPVVVALAVGGLVAAAAVAVVAIGARGDGSDETQVPASTAIGAPTGTARAGQALTAPRGRWQGAPIRFSYQWRRCNRQGGSCAAVSGATKRSYRLGGDDVGHTLRVSVSAVNDGGAGVATSKASGVVTAAWKLPASTAPPRVRGEAQEGAVLERVAGTWGGTSPITVTFAWLRCSADGSRCSAITGATSPRYTLVSRDVGSTIRLREQATNVAGKGEVRSAATPVVREQPIVTTPTDTTDVTEPKPDPTPHGSCPPDCPTFP